MTTNMDCIHLVKAEGWGLDDGIQGCWFKQYAPDCGAGTFNSCPFYTTTTQYGEGEPYASLVKALNEVGRTLADDTVSDKYKKKVHAFLVLGLDIKRAM